MKIPFFLVACFVLVVQGWTAIEFTDNNAEHPGHCYSKAVNVGAMEKGESKTLEGECVKASCGDNTHVHYYGCEEIHIPDNCKLLEEDLSKPYPDCCRKVECP